MRKQKLPNKINFRRLQTDLRTRGLPIKNVRITRDLTIDWDWEQFPTEEQFKLANEALREHQIQEATWKEQ